MTLVLPGYTIRALLYEGPHTTVYRATQEDESLSVILKVLQKEYPTPTEIAQFKQEYQLFKNLDNPRIVKAYRLEAYQNTLVLVLEDFGAESLDIFLENRRLELLDFLNIAIELAACLEDLHQHQIVHKDIKPSNITINPESGEVKLIDFGLAIAIASEQQNVTTPDLLVGTLAYMSPEQTGRMNRSLDYRTDFYSLGITFYEMLTGKLPFDASDAMGWVHCHIAVEPVAPEKLDPSIPQPISDIVMKLLEKTAEARYQSAVGLKTDLKTCLERLQKTGKIESFPLAQYDFTGQLLIPQKLYGREREVDTLSEAFNRVTEGRTELMLVAGYSGVGKSVLVQELYKPLVQQRGYFIWGKFDQFKRNVPYSALIQAFRDLVWQLLTESEEAIATWKEKLQANLGPNGAVIIDVIPEVELLVGKQPEVPHLGPSESQNRFNLVFQKFVSVFTRIEHPLVLFLDDLQWADSASLKLLQLLLVNAGKQAFLLIGAYRDNEVVSAHALTQTLQVIQTSATRINQLQLQPLSLHCISQLLADSLHCLPTSIQSLAKLLLEKTDVNPFFLTQILQLIYQKKRLYFDWNELHWCYNLEGIKTLEHSENVIEITASKIKQLSQQTQEMLQLAACIGNQFDLKTLSTVSQQSPATVARELWLALKVGLLVPLNTAYKFTHVLDELERELVDSIDLKLEYKFLHDRVAQSAYSLIPASREKEIHLNVGRLLLKNTPPSDLEDKLFEIVNLLNIGSELVDDPQECDRLIELNLMAGRKAKATNAYEAAISYLATGIDLLSPNSWDTQYSLALDLYVERVEAEFLNTNFSQAETLADLVLDRAKILFDKVKVYELKIPFYISQNKMQQAVDTALSVLKLLGISLPQKPNSLQLGVGLIRTKLTIGRKSPSDLENLPEMTDPYKLAAMRISVSAIPAIYMTNPELLPLIIFTMVNLCVKYGNSSLASYAYCMYGLALCGPLGDIEAGYPFGQLALRLVEKFEAKELKAKVYTVFNIFVRHWKEYLGETPPALLEAIQSGFETGDLEYTGHPSAFYCLHHLFMGKPLELVEEKLRYYSELMTKFKQNFIVVYLTMYQQLVVNLQEESEDPCKLTGEYFDETASIPILIQTGNRSACLFFYVAKIIVLYLLGDFAGAVENSRKATPYQDAVAGLTLSAEYNFYSSLSLLAQYPHVSQLEQKQFLKKVNANQKQMKKWMHHAPANHQYKYELVEAEKARVLGQALEAMALYDKAIESAQERECLRVSAIAWERAGEFYLALGRQKVAQTYLKEARYAYLRWGSTPKVRDLEAKYPQVLDSISAKGTAQDAIAGLNQLYNS